MRAAPAPSVRTLEERVAALEAVEAIKALKHRYLRACDLKDAETLRDCFVAEGASIDYGPAGAFEGADLLTDLYRKVALAKHDGRYVVLDMHHAVHPVIELLGDGRAKGAWTLRFRQVDRVERTEKVSAIEYDDRYEVEDGRWLIRSSHVKVLWQLTRPLPEGFSIRGAFA
ncbi:nuclear transport factor 2 family protein [Actinocorallia sp. B10E7]|uniref:nuclear transport factor 2 family protein n=1 Tax=Actinocorallia sp. B10E7 TaxID=3153558 RepID=UPI00325C839E